MIERERRPIADGHASHTGKTASTAELERSSIDNERARQGAVSLQIQYAVADLGQAAGAGDDRSQGGGVSCGHRDRRRT